MKGGHLPGHPRIKIGKFERADMGTIFLDEVGALNIETQAKLLRVLQEKEFERVGGAETIKADVRVIAATNKDLEKAVVRKEFREDLYYRLNVFPVHLPPLRERVEDIIPLAKHFLEKNWAGSTRRRLRLSEDVAKMLLGYHWPGNVRELENCMERAIIICDSNELKTFHLPPSIRNTENLTTGKSLEGILEDLNKECIIEALSRTYGNVSKASKLLGIKAYKLYFKIKKLHIDYREFRRQS